MYRFFVEPEACLGENILIGGTDYNHIKNVLRLKVGEEIAVGDGSSREYICTIQEFTGEAVVAKICDMQDSFSELSVKIRLYQGYPKGDKLETIVQKAVELGACEIVPVMMKRTIVKLDDKKAAKKVERLSAIALSAAKQSKRGIIPRVEPIMNFKEAIADAAKLDCILMPYEDARGIAYAREVVEQCKNKNTIGIFIGPEGGFDEEEVELAKAAGAHCITLGKRILRTETAGMAMLSILMFALEKDE